MTPNKGERGALASGDWSWKEKPDSVDCLSYATEIDLSCDLFDEHRCESFRAQFFVNTKVVDLARAKDAAWDQARRSRECTRKLTFDGREGSSEHQK